MFGAIRTVVGFRGEDKESNRYATNLVDARKVNIKKSFFAGLGFGLLWFFIYATYALSFWYGVGLVIDHKQLTPDEQIYTPGIMFTVNFIEKVSNILKMKINRTTGIFLCYDGCDEFRRFVAIHRVVWYC